MTSPVRLGVSLAAAPTPTGVFNQWFEALFPHAGSLGWVVCLIPQWFLPVYPHVNVGPPAPPAATSPGLPAAALPASCSLSFPAPQCATSLGPPAATLP